MATETLPATGLSTRIELSATADEVKHVVYLCQWIEMARKVLHDLEWVKEHMPEMSVKQATERFGLYSPEWDDPESYALHHMLSTITSSVMRLDRQPVEVSHG